MDQSRIGPFALEDRLGIDPSGGVFRAIHLQQRKLVALRVFPAPLVANTPAARNALVHEFDVLKSLRHPGIVRCFGGALEPMQGYIAYELIDGEPLSELLERRERLSWEQVVEFSQQICDALECAHQAGVVHECLCPEKLIVGSDGHIRICDFRVDPLHNPWCAASQRRTLDRAAFVAPEQWRADEPATYKSDLYALGCIMYRMLTGANPFEGTTVEQIRDQHLMATAAPASTRVFECPVWLDTLLTQLLEKEPLRRPHSASVVSRALLETRQVVAAKTSVSEHLTSGFSPLTARANKEEAQRLLGKKVKKQRHSDDDEVFYERPWFLATCLASLIAAVSAFAFWPVSEDKLYQKAKALMDADDPVGWQTARDDYLVPLVEKFPNGIHADWAHEQLDKLAMALTEKQLRNKLRIGRKLTESEQHMAEAWNFEQFGDRFSAVEKYESIVNLFHDDVESRDYVNLAKHRMAQIERESGGDRTEFIQKQLDKADELASDGNEMEARKIWKSIVNLYSGKAELDSFVSRAESRLERKKSKAKSAESDEPPESAR